jgi:hypothetical protein
MTARAPRTTPTPTPAFAPVERSLCEGEGSEVGGGVEAVALELIPDAEVVKVAEVDDVLGDSRTMLVAVQPSNGTGKTVCRRAGDGALNCSLLGLLQLGLSFASTPQHCQSPDVLFHLASEWALDVHLFVKPGQRPVLSVQPAT